MHRNAAILGFSALAVLALVLGLAWSWRGTSNAEAPELGQELRAEPAVEATPLVLDGRPSEVGPERRTTESAVAAPCESSADETETDAADQDPLLVAGRVVDLERSPVYRA